jgi:hypothetical protein
MIWFIGSLRGQESTKPAHSLAVPKKKFPNTGSAIFFLVQNLVKGLLWVVTNQPTSQNWEKKKKKKKKKKI